MPAGEEGLGWGIEDQGDGAVPAMAAGTLILGGQRGPSGSPASP